VVATVVTAWAPDSDDPFLLPMAGFSALYEF
jgi:hypothetical protein